MIKKVIRDIFYKYFPKRFVIDYIATRTIGRKINWRNPIDINDKINILKLTVDTKMWSDLADKYSVRKYISDKGLSEILIPLIAKYDNAKDIDFSKLPNAFVLKTNHGCGEVVIVKDKSRIDENTIREQMYKHLQYKYGLYQAEYHYLYIKPCIVAEQLISETDSRYSSSIIDYKVWCFNGKPYCILCCFNRGENTNVALYDTQWNYLHGKISRTNHFTEKSDYLPKPLNLDKMIDDATILSKDFPEVRVDFYNVNGKIYFGEMTFTSLGGFMNYFTDDFLKELGNQINLKK